MIETAAVKPVNITVIAVVEDRPRFLLVLMMAYLAQIVAVFICGLSL